MTADDLFQLYDLLSLSSFQGGYLDNISDAFMTWIFLLRYRLFCRFLVCTALIYHFHCFMARKQGSLIPPWAWD